MTMIAYAFLQHRRLASAKKVGCAQVYGQLKASPEGYVATTLLLV